MGLIHHTYPYLLTTQEVVSDTISLDLVDADVYSDHVCSPQLIRHSAPVQRTKSFLAAQRNEPTLIPLRKLCQVEQFFTD